ncbi:hypothetical protein BDK51DRAFT_40917 [Blyttiomyces helicus]|uniref:Pentacotripeptide-repeat region of PRORP domain-containing protein n=1 Tax=Blyttiomyces helicus TaxID=388810 RepID=A0A4P9WD44_9FUNG|nr:hypothetical protein BDK51DRAFT_40917 [Blyttiomyces helicus]|eukprot:RKO88296.1 hypothetical protein BDK51DRAFT_40917 [Blyttiomyces helicus]
MFYAHELYRTFSLDSALSNAGITPGGSYSLRTIDNAIASAYPNIREAHLCTDDGNSWTVDRGREHLPRHCHLLGDLRPGGSGSYPICETSSPSREPLIMADHLHEETAKKKEGLRRPRKQLGAGNFFRLTKSWKPQRICSLGHLHRLNAPLASPESAPEGLLSGSGTRREAFSNLVHPATHPLDLQLILRASSALPRPSALQATFPRRSFLQSTSASSALNTLNLSNGCPSPSLSRPLRVPAFAALPPSLLYSTSRDMSSENSLPETEPAPAPDSSADPAPAQSKPSAFSWLSFAASSARVPRRQVGPRFSQPPPAEPVSRAASHEGTRSLNSEMDGRRLELNWPLSAQRDEVPLSPAHNDAGPRRPESTPPRQPDPAPGGAIRPRSSVEEEPTERPGGSPPQPPPLTEAGLNALPTASEFGRTPVAKYLLDPSAGKSDFAKPRRPLNSPPEDQTLLPHATESESKYPLDGNVLGVRPTKSEVKRHLDSGRRLPRDEPAPVSSAQPGPMATSHRGPGVRIAHPEIQRPGFVPNPPSAPVRPSPTRYSSNQDRAPSDDGKPVSVSVPDVRITHPEIQRQGFVLNPRSAPVRPSATRYTSKQDRAPSEDGKPVSIEDFRAALEARDSETASRIYASHGKALVMALTEEDSCRYLSLLRKHLPTIKPIHALGNRRRRDQERLARARYVERTFEDFLRDGATFILEMTNEVALAYVNIGAVAEVDRVIDAGEARSAGEKLRNAKHLRLLARAKSALYSSSLPPPSVSELVDEMDALVTTSEAQRSYLFLPAFNAVLEEVVRRGDEAAYERMWALAEQYKVATDMKSFELKIEHTAKRDIDAARRLLQDGPKSGFSHTIRSYNSILQELVRAKRREEITPLFRNMEDNGVRANASTYAILLSAYDPTMPYGEEDPAAAAMTFLAMCSSETIPLLIPSQSQSLARSMKSIVAIDGLEPFLAREGLAPNRYLYEALISGFFKSEPKLALRVGDLYLAHSALNRDEWPIDDDWCVRYLRSLQYIGSASEWQSALDAFIKAGHAPTSAILDQILRPYSNPTALASQRAEMAVEARKVFDRILSQRLRTNDYPRTLTRLLSTTWDEFGEEPLNRDALVYMREYARHAPQEGRFAPRHLIPMRRAVSIVGSGDYAMGILRLRNGDVDLPLSPPGPVASPSPLVNALRDLIAAGRGAEWEAVLEDWRAKGHAPTTGAYNVILAYLGRADREVARRIFDAMRAGGPNAAPNGYTYCRLVAIEWRGKQGPSPLSENAITYLEAFADTSESPPGLNVARRHLIEHHLYAALSIIGQGSAKEGIVRLRARGRGSNVFGAHAETPKDENPSTAL